MTEGIWLELVTLGALVWLGYMGARVAGRFKLPSVTGFLLVGIVLGPYGLGLLSLELLHKIDFVNTLAVGLVVFLIGEEMTADMLRRHHWSFWVISIGGIALPAGLVALGMMRFAPGVPAIAWVLGAIAMSGAPATLMAVAAETKATGRSCDMLLGSSAFADIATVIAYSLVGPILLLQTGDIGSFAQAGAEESLQVVGGVALGIAFGLILGVLLRRPSDSGEILAIGLTHVLLVVGVAHVLGVSTILAPLAMGITVAVIEEKRGARGRCFSALRTVEYPVYIIFFTLAGAELDFSVALAGGALMIVYIVARSAGKFLAGFGGSLLSGLSPTEAAWFGLGSLPQAGVAVGLALAASTDYPDAGPTITAVVLASILFFEAVGPVAAKRAMEMLHCPDGSCELEEQGPVCRERLVLVPVSLDQDAAGLVPILRATDSESECSSVFVLAHIVTAGGRFVRDELLESRRVLERLSAALAEDGFRIETRIEQSPTMEDAVSMLAEQLGADLVVLGTTPAKSPGFVRRFVRSPLHKIIDRLSTPVFIVPEGWEPQETGAHIASTVESLYVGIGEGAEIPAPGPDGRLASDDLGPAEKGMPALDGEPDDPLPDNADA